MGTVVRKPKRLTKRPIPSWVGVEKNRKARGKEGGDGGGGTGKKLWGGRKILSISYEVLREGFGLPHAARKIWESNGSFGVGGGGDELGGLDCLYFNVGLFVSGWYLRESVVS